MENISGKLLSELRSAFSLLTKSLRSDGIDVSLDINSVVYPTQFRPVARPYPYAWRPFMQTNDGLDPNDLLRGADGASRQSGSISLFHEGASLQEISCEWQATLVSEPIFSEANAILSSVDFSNISNPTCQKLVVESIAQNAPSKSLPVQKSSTVSRQVPLSPVKKPEPYKLPLATFRRQARPCPTKLWELPITKTPLPPHRFPSDMKQQFRKFLADKVGVAPATIQIQVVFDRINLSLYSSIDQDERGHLVCYPKPELLQNPSKAKSLPSTYLVFGLRMDNKETVKALVPASAATGASSSGSYSSLPPGRGERK